MMGLPENLGQSYNSSYYGIDGKEEAVAYLSHPVLGKGCGRLWPSAAAN